MNHGKKLIHHPRYHQYGSSRGYRLHLFTVCITNYGDHSQQKLEEINQLSKHINLRVVRNPFLDGYIDRRYHR